MEEDPMLASVLAFLDAFDADGEHEKQQKQQKEQKEQSEASAGSKNVSAAKKRRIETKYTTNLQRKKRAELSDLREQAARLEARLKQLHKVTSDRTGENGGEKKLWTGLEEEEAVKELEARRRAEADNKRLREGLERQARLREEICRVVKKFNRQETLVDDEKSVGAVSKCDSLTPMAVANTPEAVPIVGIKTCFTTEYDIPRAAIPCVLEQLVNQIDCVFSSSCHRSQSSWLETSEVGRAMEIRMSTRTSCSVIAAADILWRKPKEKLICSKVASNEVYTENGSALFTRSLLPTQCRPWDNRDSSPVEIILNVEHNSRRVYDASSGRVVLVTFALIRLPGEDEVLLRERFWKCITPIQNSKVPSSIVQTSYRIERGDGRDIKPSPAQASVMRSLVQLTRRNHAMYQDWLLEA